MITIRNFTRNHLNDLKKNKYSNMPAADIINMIDLWNLKKYKGNYFEMFAIISDYKIARAQILVDNKGSISLHKKLGFVQKSITINNKGNEVYLLEKVL